MKLYQLKLRNFRSYKEEIIVNFENLTTFVGKNDAGKSTILEALEIFFNNTSISCEKNDLSITHNEGDENIEITCVFKEFPSEIIIDTNVPTPLKEEYLLNSEGFLEIKKVFDCKSSKIKQLIYLVSNYPTNPKCSDLYLLKLSDLKKRAKELGISEDSYDSRISSSIRKSIYNNCEDLNLSNSSLLINNELTKQIYNELEKYLPMYALFQSDRSSSDSDREITDPMQIAITKAIKELEEEINKIKEEVRKKTLETANRTLEKLKEMNSSLADSLIPEFKSEPKFESLFKLTINSDNGIPINKRGSGVRRLILLNFFRAEAERKLKDNEKNNQIIYAFEEPETSQHPSHQKMLVEAFLELTKKEDCQIILTTHTPNLCSILPLSSLRLIKKQDGINSVFSNDETIYNEIAEMLGVLPEIIDNSAKGVVLVEGKDDVLFFKHITKLLKNAGEINKTFEEENIITLPTGGCDNLKYWITKKIIKNLDLPWCVFLDSDKLFEEDITKNMELIRNIIKNDNIGFYTRKREIENYFHIDLLKEKYPTLTTIADYSDIKKETHKKVFEKFWEKMTFEHLRERETYFKDGKTYFELTDIVKTILNMVK